MIVCTLRYSLHYKRLELYKKTKSAWLSGWNIDSLYLPGLMTTNFISVISATA